MKKSPFRYDTIFLYASLQSVGHIIEYFSSHTRKLVIFIIMPRLSRVSNELWVYKNGKIQEKRVISTSANLFAYYILWFFHHIKILLTCFSPNEPVVVLAGHPVALFGMSMIKRMRKVTYAYWIGDYFPPVHWSLIAFEKLKKYYQDRVPYTFYLSDRINKVYNGKVVNSPIKKTIMWGVKPYSGPQRKIIFPFRLLFVGAIRPSQGIEDLLLFIKKTKDVQLSIIGVCEIVLYQHYIQIIKDYDIAGRVWFPNTFLSDADLKKISRNHHVGIAIYEKGKHTATHYTDPGKIKTYIEMGLPVIMTDTSAIVPYIQKYDAGIVIDSAFQLVIALRTLQKQYVQYQKGVQVFSKYFEYEKYYHNAFVILESREL